MLSAGLTTADVQDLKRRLDARAQVRLLELAANYLHDDCFGFRLAQSFELGEIGLLYYVMASSERLVDALQNAERYCSINNEGVRLRVSLEHTFTIGIEYLGIDRLADRHHIEFWLVTLVRICRTLTNGRLAPAQVKLKHFRPETPSHFPSYLGCGIDFAANSDEIRFPAPIGVLPVVGADGHLNRLLLQYADEALRDRASRRASVRFNVEDQIVKLLPHGKANAPEIARRLGMSRRTLGRALSSEGATYSDVLKTLRQALAKRYLREKEIPISEIAWLLGYSEISSFTHAFARWTGLTPKSFRTSRDVR
jgi:AraC-like DNA-binding protein